MIPNYGRQHISHHLFGDEHHNALHYQFNDFDIEPSYYLQEFFD
jgi:hypothetical protein